MFGRKLCLSLLCCLSATGVWAQYDAAFAQYWSVQPFYNPASVGKDPKLNIVGAYNMSLTGFTHNPKTMYIGADMPVRILKSYHGVGIGIVNDQIGLFRHQNIQAQFAATVHLFGGDLKIGGQVGLINENFEGSKLDLDDADDPAFIKSDQTGSSLDLSAGIYYKHRNFYVGASAKHLNSPMVELGEQNQIDIGMSYYFLGGCNIKTNIPFVSIQPSCILRTDMSAYKADITVRGTYTKDGKRLEAGVSYSPKTSYTIYLGGDFHGVNLGYSYEIYTSALKIGNGSHELTLGYQMDVDMTKKGKNKHKSVRLL